jgi:hypothetical protein
MFRYFFSDTVPRVQSSKNEVPKNSGQSIAADFLLERQSISRFSRVLFCSFVLFRFCTSDTGSGIGNDQRGGPSVRRKWTSGRGCAQMPVGLLILRVSLPLLSFSLFLHCRHRSTPSIWPPKGPRATPKELPRVPKSSQDRPSYALVIRNSAPRLPRRTQGAHKSSRRAP